MDRLGCFIFLAAILCALCVATSGDEFQLGFLSMKHKGRNRLHVTVNYTASSQPAVRITVFDEGSIQSASPRRHTFSDGQGQAEYFLPTRRQLSPNITFTFPRTTVTLLLRLLPPRPGRGVPSVDKAEPVPDVRFEPEGDIVYAESGDVSVDLRVSAGVGREAVSEERLSYTSYVKEGAFFYVSEDWPVSIVEDASVDSGAVYRLGFNTSQQRPEGVLVLKALKVYSEEGGPELIAGVQVEKRVDFFQRGHARPVTADTLAFVRQWSDTELHISSSQLCDLSLSPACSVSCAAVSGQQPRLMLENMSGKVDNTVTSSKMGFLTVTSAPLPDVSDGRERVWCEAIVGEDYRGAKEQMIEVSVRQSPQILQEGSSAVLHPNQTLEVRCIATGLPMPAVVFTEPDDPSNTPLEQRFPNKSFLRIIEVNSQVAVQYWLWESSFISTLTHVRCTADNGFKDPAVVLLEVVQASSSR